MFERRKMVRGEGLPVLEERMKTMDTDENEICKFLGVEQADGMKTKTCLNKLKMKSREEQRCLLNDANLIRAINEKVISASAYLTNLCQFNKRELMELDQVFKREFRSR